MTEAVQAILADYPMPEGYSAETAGAYEDMMESVEDLLLALTVALGLVYFVLAAQFESFLMPVIVMMILPVAFGGALVALPLTGRDLSMISLVALIILMVFTGCKFYWTAFLGLYPLLTLFVFSLGIGLFLAMAVVFFRDVMHIWGVFCTALMYFSAIFYDPELMSGFVQKIIKFNPLYWYITGFRKTVLYGEMLSTNMILVCGGCALVSIVIGLWAFRKHQDKFVLHL
jgi:hypothetical protein